MKSIMIKGKLKLMNIKQIKINNKYKFKIKKMNCIYKKNIM